MRHYKNDPTEGKGEVSEIIRHLNIPPPPAGYSIVYCRERIPKPDWLVWADGANRWLNIESSEGIQDGIVYASPPLTTNIRSSHGHIVINTHGAVVEVEEDTTEEDKGALTNIYAFDVEEWKAHYGKKDLSDEIDILNIGYWYHDEKGVSHYEEPAHDHRQLLEDLAKTNFETAPYITEVPSIPYPGEYENTANYARLEWLEQLGFKGNDESLEESLFEYGLIWCKLPRPNDFGDDHIVIYAADRTGAMKFASATMCLGNMRKELYGASDAEWCAFLQFTGVTHPHPEKVEGLCYHLLQSALTYWGYVNVFSSNPYTFEIANPRHVYGLGQKPGETVEEYERRVYGGDDEALIPGDFVRGETGVWFAAEFGSALAQWHKDCDIISVVDSHVIANKEVKLEWLKEAIVEMEKRRMSAHLNDFDRVEATALIEIMKYALKAEPGDEAQTAEF